ncbi:CoA transferase [Zwartia sp.]|uniref:CaiB/BaiF CoA transferase family protein n=1 Tax=Zwartia sp. TaxID=2978004 RepID=UPI00271DA4E5|nr:CoA transferase [Zwartia sp.]MDO9025792.1 CoA transferase [Zwartia sp.]
MTLPYEALPKVSASSGFSHLSGLRVLDLSTSVAGPYAAQLLGDFGATVVKIEKPGTGDDARHWGPPFLNGASLWYLSVNRNKHSMVLDMNQAEGLDILMQMLEMTDVLILNMTPRVQEKLGLDYAKLQQRFPRLIHASLTGFGLTGRRRDDPCYDLIAEGYSGIMDLTGEIESDPQKVGTPAADMLAGQDLAMAVLAALNSRHQTGIGCSVDISMHASMTRFMAPRVVSYLGSAELPRRSGGKDSVIAIYQVFDASDAQLSLGLGNDAIWKRFWETVGDVSFGAQTQYASNAGRREHRAAIVVRIAEILRTKTRDEWLALFSKSRIPAGPINRVDEVVRDEDLLDKEFFYTSESGYGVVPQVGLGIGMNGQQSVHRKSPPTLGEDTNAILQDWLSFKADRIADLKKKGIVNE